MSDATQYKLVAFHTHFLDLTAGENPVPLHENKPCDAVLLSLRNTDDAGADAFRLPYDDTAGGYREADLEIYWGTNEVGAHQIFPTESTDKIGCNNAHDIWVRASTKSPGVRVFYTLFRYEPIGERESQ